MNITDYHRRNAKQLGVSISASKSKGKKVAVTLPDGKLRHVGAKGYEDYKTYEKKKGGQVAMQKLDAYRARHRCHNAERFSNRHLACEILWRDPKKTILRGK